MAAHPSQLSWAAHRVVVGAFEGPTLPDWVRRQLGDGLGSVALFGSNIEDDEQAASLNGAIHAAGSSVITCTDEEGGDVTRLHMRRGSPQPGNAALGRADDEQLTQRVAAQIASQLATVGFDLDLAPVVDVNSNPDNPVIGVRSFGADPALVARHTRAYVRGLQSGGVGACVKHFPGHGDTTLDSHLSLPRVEADLQSLRRRELAPFEAAAAVPALAVMTSHVLVPALDADRPATLSPTILGMLRASPSDGGLGYEGLIVSDALDMKGASAGRGEPAAAVLALAAGCDLLCIGADQDAETIDAVVGAILEAVRCGDLAEQRLTEAASRVDAAAQTLALWRLDRLASVGAEAGGSASAQAVSALALEAATRAIRVSGELPAIESSVVLRIVTETTMAVGRVPWGLPADGAVLRTGRQHDVLEGARAADLEALAQGAPLVALVREQHRHPWVGALLADLHRRRPDLVIAEMGWPSPGSLPSAATIWAFGASRANSAALDALLSGADPTPAADR